MITRRIEILLFTLLMICALAVPAQAAPQECEDEATCTFNDDPIITTTTVTTGAVTTTATGGASSVGDILVQGSGATIGDVDGSATLGDIEASVGDVTGEGGDGGAGGDVKIDYPDQPVSSPAMAIGGVCQSAVSLTTKDMAASIGSGDQLCRHIELIKLALIMAKIAPTEAAVQAKLDDAERLYQETLAMEKRGSWFRRCPLTGWITGLPIVGRLF